MDRREAKARARASFAEYMQRQQEPPAPILAPTLAPLELEPLGAWERGGFMLGVLARGLAYQLGVALRFFAFGAFLYGLVTLGGMIAP